MHDHSGPEPAQISNPEPSSQASASAVPWQTALTDRLRFYRDLGITDFYRCAVPEPIQQALAQGAPAVPAAVPTAVPTAVQAQPAAQPRPNPAASPSAVIPAASPTEALIPRIPVPAPPAPIAPIPPSARPAALEALRTEIGDCTRCKLHQGRNKLVFGDGDPAARLLFVGEGPGADEDAQGIPFVGRGGQLLNNMIGAMGLRRDQVYIANVVKCRPPGNRTPEADEGATCSPFLMRQIQIVAPEVVVALGQTAVTWLTGQKRPLNAWRGSVHQVLGAKLIVTFHPAYLLRDPNQKKFAWEDLQLAMRELGLQPPQRKS